MRNARRAPFGSDRRDAPYRYTAHPHLKRILSSYLKPPLRVRPLDSSAGGKGAQCRKHYPVPIILGTARTAADIVYRSLHAQCVARGGVLSVEARALLRRDHRQLLLRLRHLRAASSHLHARQHLHGRDAVQSRAHPRDRAGACGEAAARQVRAAGRATRRGLAEPVLRRFRALRPSASVRRCRPAPDRRLCRGRADAQGQNRSRRVARPQDRA